MIAAALDVDRAEVDDALEARPAASARRGSASGCPAAAPGRARCAAGCRSARRSCTAARRRARASTASEADLLEQVRVAERDVQRDHELDLVALGLDLDALGLERLELRVGVVRRLADRLELAVDHAVRAVADDGELVPEAGVHVRPCSPGTPAASRRGRGGTRCR